MSRPSSTAVLAITSAGALIVCGGLNLLVYFGLLSPSGSVRGTGWALLLMAAGALAGLAGLTLRRRRPRIHADTTARSRLPRRHLLLLTVGALVVLQVAHLLDALRYDPAATFPAVLFDPGALLTIAVTAATFLAVAYEWPSFETLAAFVGGGIAVGFTLHHGIPIDLGTNNPYWGTADAIQWAIVLAAIGTGALACWVATRRPY
jgi:hypothetical protein